MGMPAPTAGGTNILVSSISSIFGAIRPVREGRVNFRLVLFQSPFCYRFPAQGRYQPDFSNHSKTAWLPGGVTVI